MAEQKVNQNPQKKNDLCVLGFELPTITQICKCNSTNIWFNCAMETVIFPGCEPLQQTAANWSELRLGPRDTPRRHFGTVMPSITSWAKIFWLTFCSAISGRQTSTVFPSSKTSSILLEFAIFLARRGAKVSILAKNLRVFQQTHLKIKLNFFELVSKIEKKTPKSILSVLANIQAGTSSETNS